MNALKVLLLAGMTVLILLTPQPAAAQSVGCNLIYQAGDDPNAEPQDGDCPKVLPALGSAVALTTALIVYGLILRHGYLSGANTSGEEGGERALKEGVDEAVNSFLDHSPAGSPWNLSAFTRGFEIERILGGNLVKNFPTIDRWARGVATSIKSVDLTARTYLYTAKFSGRLTRYVNSVADFNGRTWGGREILAENIVGRELVVGIEPGVASAVQRTVLNQIIDYGATRGVVVRIVEVP